MTKFEELCCDELEVLRGTLEAPQRTSLLCIKYIIALAYTIDILYVFLISLVTVFTKNMLLKISYA